MEVICIDNTAPCHKDSIVGFHPMEGDSYTVTEIVNWYGLEWYLLKEDTGGYGWNPRYFIPLSKIDEKKILYEKEKI